MTPPRKKARPAREEARFGFLWKAKVGNVASPSKGIAQGEGREGENLFSLWSSRGLVGCLRLAGGGGGGAVASRRLGEPKSVRGAVLVQT